MPHVNRSDIQGNILEDFGLGHACHVFARFPDAGRARRLLDLLRCQVTTAAHDTCQLGAQGTLNLALSFAGLEALQLPGSVLDGFPQDFRAGMAARCGLLSDAPSTWDPFWRRRDVHAWFSIHADSRAAVDRRVRWLRELSRPFIDWHDHHITTQHTYRDGHPVEHFGFRDGISNPVLYGSLRDCAAGHGKLTADGHWVPLATGEFLFGYPDESGERPPVPCSKLMRNGTFVVLRKLHQCVADFRRYIGATAARLGQPADLVAAKIVGRWPDGRPLAGEHANAAMLSESTINDFDFADDPRGAGCPLGAHIRRANPRNSPGPASSPDRHRLIRRGMPYGDALPDGAEDDGRERGLLFIAMNASLERQFEFVQRRWLNDGANNRQGHDVDPLLGREGPASNKFIIQGDLARGRVPWMCTELPRFVRARGGGYFFMPGVNAIGMLAERAFAHAVGGGCAS